LDVEIPELSGLDFMKYLRAQYAINHIPVIFVTSHGTQDIIRKAKVSGTKGFVVKPVGSNILLKKTFRV
jgi:FixJ family two-component response regulator